MDSATEADEAVAEELPAVVAEDLVIEADEEEEVAASLA